MLPWLLSRNSSKNPRCVAAFIHFFFFKPFRRIHNHVGTVLGGEAMGRVNGIGIGSDNYFSGISLYTYIAIFITWSSPYYFPVLYLPYYTYSSTTSLYAKSLRPFILVNRGLYHSYSPFSLNSYTITLISLKFLYLN